MIQGNNGNHFYETPDLKLAVFLFIKDVPFKGLRWETTNQAFFLFDNPPAEVWKIWMETDKEYVTKYEKARNYLRDVIEGKRQ